MIDQIKQRFAQFEPQALFDTVIGLIPDVLAACVVLLSLGVQRAAAQAVVDIDTVVIVLDASGSMNEPMPRDTRTKMQVAR